MPVRRTCLSSGLILMGVMMYGVLCSGGAPALSDGRVVEAGETSSRPHISREGSLGAAVHSELLVAAGDWPWWRGPDRNGIADAQQAPPLKWDESTNVLWKNPLPGRGHGSPIVVGDQVVIATADVERQIQSLICFDRETGKRHWESVIHQGGVVAKGNEKSSLASGTPACDGERFYMNFLNSDGIWVSAVDRTGKMVWQIRLCDYVMHQGFGASPCLYQNVVLIAADHKGKGVLAGLSRTTGEILWKRERPALPNYPAPIVLNVAGRDQMLMQGCSLVTSLDPVTGEQFWEIEGATEECVTSTVTDGERIFTSGGYPKNHIAAVAADGSGKVVWENTTRSYVPSMIAHNGYLYSLLDAGMAICSRCDTGEEIWRKRLGGTFSSSLVLVGETLYASNEEGTTWVFRATPDGYQELGENKLGDSIYSTRPFAGAASISG